MKRYIKAQCVNIIFSLIQGGSFSGMSGFSFKPTDTSTPFSFNVKSVTNGQGTSSSEAKSDSKSATMPIASFGQNGKSALNDSKSKLSSSYSENLKKLNESVLSWIKSHVDKNPFCILTPIFKDYEKHLDTLEKEKEKGLSTEAAKSENKSTEKSSSPVKTPAEGILQTDSIVTLLHITNENISTHYRMFKQHI